ncbi:CPBP family intramembrane metalloprotease, partial [Staphylococcus aureus]
MSGVSLILLVVSGTVAGILYGMTAYKFNSIWPSVFMHMCWNLSDFVHIATHNDDYGVIQYIIKVKNILLTGGAYGNTSSLIVTSVLFALVHLFNGGMSGVSLILLVVSGTVAGILYGMTAYKFNSIWP